jgi:hypothetical protein
VIKSSMPRVEGLLMRRTAAIMEKFAKPTRRHAGRGDTNMTDVHALEIVGRAISMGRTAGKDCLTESYLDTSSSR